MPTPNTNTTLRPSALFWRTLVYISLSLNIVFFLTAFTFWINVTGGQERYIIYVLIAVTVLMTARGWQKRKSWPEHGWSLLITGIFMTVVALDLLVLYNGLLLFANTISSV